VILEQETDGSVAVLGEDVVSVVDRDYLWHPRKGEKGIGDNDQKVGYGRILGSG
jgi:hypothetical protein